MNICSDVVLIRFSTACCAGLAAESTHSSGAPGHSEEFQRECFELRVATFIPYVIE